MRVQTGFSHRTRKAESPKGWPGRLRRLTEKPAWGSPVLVTSEAQANRNTLALDQSGVGWVWALPWNQAPPACREMPLDQLTALSGDHPGVQAARTTQVVHGRERACVLKYSSSFLSEQVHSLSTSVATTTQALRRLSGTLARPDCRLTETQLRTKTTRRLATARFLDGLIRYTLIHTAAFQSLLTERPGRTVLMTRRVDWSAEQVVAAT